MAGIIAATAALGGCASFTPRQVAEPSGVTLQAAVRDVAESIDYLRSRPPESHAGLMLDEVTVTFNVAASANAKNSGQLDLDATVAPVTIGASGSTELTNDAQRGNHIVMKFKNLATADYSKGSFVTQGTSDYAAGASLRQTQRRAPPKPTAPSPGPAPGSGSKPGKPEAPEIPPIDLPPWLDPCNLPPVGGQSVLSKGKNC